jgi:hypothetical protein
MQRAAHIALTALACLLLCASPAPAWQIGVGEPMPDRCYSVAEIPGLGLLAGSYEGDGRVYTLDPETLTWRVWRKIEVRITNESMSYLLPIDGGAGVNLFTEDSSGPECWTAWAPAWRFTSTRVQMPRSSMYALGGPEAARICVAAVSAGLRRQVGGVLSRWDADAWRPFTSELWYNGRPCLIWTATSYNGRLLAGASFDNRDYLAPGVGLLAEWLGDRWAVLPTPTMAGIVRLTQLDGDPGTLFLSTTRGQLWRTTDLAEFTLYHDGDGRHGDAWVFNLNDSRVVANARGRIWDDGRLVLDRPGTAWLSPVKLTLPDGRQVLAGTITNEGERFSRVMRIDPPEATP